MQTDPNSDPYRQKFRADADPSLDAQVDAALAGVSLDELYAQKKPAPVAAPAAGEGESPGRPPSTAAVAASRGNRLGTIVSIDANDVLVDFGGKSQGIASLLQFEEEPKVGQVVEFHVDRFDPRQALLILTRKGATSQNVNWENLQEGQIVEGTVTGVNKGGLELEVRKMRAFMPAGQVDINFHQDISTFIGQRITAEVTQFDRDSHKLVLSRRAILEREKEEARQKLLTELEEGQTRNGTVRSVMDYGAFVDLGGVDGLVHISEMSYRRGAKPSEFVKVGDLVEVKVIKFDKDTGKVSLSLKQAMPDPWTGIESRYTVGSQVNARVARIEQFGAFVELEAGVEGLLPASEISWQRFARIGDILKVGDTVRLAVLSVDPAQRRMSLSLKQAGPDPWAAVTDRYATGMVVAGKITRLVDFGAFVELEPGLEGLVHISELAPHRIKTPSEVVQPDQDVQVRILEIDKDHRRISLSIRKAIDPAPAAPAAPAGKLAAPKKKKQLKGGLDWNW
ncbi:MAG TPA: S1 RNA-binding domain-containing protein [Tepidisphaeraceae bacterium]|jgi:small subunit ribosomal protein S1|nr:S1 RNA-binding domain-containing protein [Tepidisphaeraceae bacterium]